VPLISAYTRERKLRERLRDDLEWFAAKELMVSTKEDGLQRLRFNSAQRLLHAKLQQQRKDEGRVRAIVLKGRQAGISTYTAARFYHRTIHYPGTKTFILTHEDAATTNLFDMVKRFHARISEFCRPVTNADNRTELSFDEMASGYQIATARTAGAGRSATVQLFHASEVSRWPNAAEHVAGVMQAVPIRNSEIILESTANGMGNLFHEYWKEAEAGRSDFMPVFIPWTMQTEYTAPSAHLALTSEEKDLKKLFGLTDGQVAWRRRKISEFKAEHDIDAEAYFQIEYPLTPEEAFKEPGHVPFISKKAIYRAAGRNEEPSGPLLIGVDPAGDGTDGDRTAIVWRAGRKCLRCESWRGMDTMQVVGLVKQIIDKWEPARVFIDANGLGKGVYDRLREFDGPYRKVVRAINGGSSPFYPPPPYGGGPRNRRAEMWMLMKDWLEAGQANSDEADVPVSIPKNPELIRDLLGPARQYADSNGRILIEGKRDMKRRGVASPDLGDALALTFAEPVQGATWKEAYGGDSDYGRVPWWVATAGKGRPSEWCQ
jgi:hypothetical protein